MAESLPPQEIKDRIVLSLCNRTPFDSEISLFALPQGSNESQTISYGESLETKYCDILVPTSDFGSAKSWTINWTDEAGAAQTATFTSTTIDDLIAEINSASNEQMSYVLEAPSYRIFKRAIDTYFYFIPPKPITFSPSTYTKGSLGDNLFPIPIVDIAGSSKFYGTTRKGYFIVVEDDLNFFEYSDPTSAFSQTDLLAAPYSMTTPAGIAFDPINNYVWVMDQGTEKVKVIDLDSSLSLITTLTPSTSPDGCNGLIFYNSKFKKMIQMALSSGGSEKVTIWDVTTITEDFSGLIKDPSGTPILLEGNLDAVVTDGAGDSWLWSGTAVLADEGVFRLDGNDTVNGTTDKSFYPTLINTANSFDKRSSIKYANGNFILLGWDSGGADSAIEVWTKDGSQVSERTITGVRLETLIYDDSFGEFIIAISSDDVDARVISTVTGEVVGTMIQDAGNSLTAIYGAFINGDTGFDQLVLIRQSNPTNNSFGTIAAPFTVPAGAKAGELYTDNVFSTLVNNTDTITYNWACYNVIEGTGISVEDEAGISYSELIAGIRTNADPYLFYNIAVFAETLEQANTTFQKAIRGIDGTVECDFDAVTITPMQSQFVVNSIPLNFLPKAISGLNYVVKAQSCVRLIVNYRRDTIDKLVEEMEKIENGQFGNTEEIYLNLPEVNKLMDIIINPLTNITQGWSSASGKPQKQVGIPLLSVINPRPVAQNKSLMAQIEAIKSNVKMSYDEIVNDQNNSDFTEVE